MLYVSIILMIGGFYSAHCQLIVTHSQNAQALMNMITGSGVVAFNPVLIHAYDSSAGFFDGRNSNLGLDSGIILGTGSIYLAEGPNDDCCSGQGGNFPYLAGNPLLDPIAGSSTQDATTLTFDLVASCDSVGIRFVFASEEYPEFTCNQYNDVFGFFIDGPGYTGPTNIAFVPGTATPITINTIHDGSNGSPYFPCPAINASYYVNNGDGSTPALNPTVQYDGFTTVIDVKAAVQPCDTFQITFTIADGFDDVWDSGIFIEAGGLRCTYGQVNLNANSVISGGSNIIVEGCADGFFSFTRNGDLTNPITVGLTTAGTATPGVDYSNMPSTLTFPAGQDSLSLPVNAFLDLNNEGMESLYLILLDTVCAIPVQDTATLYISDQPIANFTFKDACVGESVTFSDSSIFPAGNLNDFQWDFGDGNSGVGQVISHTYTIPGVYTVILSASNPQGCTDQTSQSIIVISSPIADFSFIGVCEGLPTQFTDLSSPGSGGVFSSWTWNIGGTNVTQQNPSYTFSIPGSYSVRLIVENQNRCRDTSTQVVIIPEPTQVEFTFPTACAEDSITFSSTLIPPIGGIISSQNWDFGDGNTSSSADPTHAYINPGNYFVKLTTVNSFGCEYILEQFITVNPNPVADFYAEPVCIEFPTEFDEQSTISSGALVGWSWDFDDGSSIDIREPTHTYAQPNLYNVTLIVSSDSGCVTSIIRPVEVFEAPLPPIPIDDSVCFGEQATLEVLGGENAEIFWYYNLSQTSSFHQGPLFTTVPVTETLLYWLQTATSEGCVSDYFPIKAVLKDIKIFIPNAFTPNGDNLNDEFDITTQLITDIELSIYDRWGTETLFTYSGLDFQWKGDDQRGRTLPTGVYVYRLKAVDCAGRIHQRAGTVTLIR